MITNEWGVDQFYNNNFFRLIYSFHMPAFMIVSGFLYSVTTRGRSISLIVISRIKSILIPTIAWNIIGYAVFYLPIHIDVLHSLSKLVSSLIAYATLWFLISLFINSIIAASIQWLECKVKGKQDGLSPTICIALIVFSCIAGMLIPVGASYTFMVPYFFLGYLLSIVTPDLFSKNRITVIEICGTVLFFILLPFYNNDVYVYNSGVYVAELIQVVIDIFRWVIGICGTLFLMCVLKIGLRFICSNTNPITSILAHLGKNTLPLYAIQILTLPFYCEFINRIFGELLQMDTELTIDIFCVAISLVYIVIMMAVINSIKRFKCGNIVLLGGRK